MTNYPHIDVQHAQPNLTRLFLLKRSEQKEVEFCVCLVVTRMMTDLRDSIYLVMTTPVLRLASIKKSECLKEAYSRLLYTMS